MEKKCMHCGTELDKEDSFCPACGEDID
ncbi:zinc-ribbon domain-containing protein [Candidatus Woesearchaeota archaeon]|nr:zinc-ribbon domain-containing protein [Candidatus Woesearchaeota archaeon]